MGISFMGKKMCPNKNIPSSQDAFMPKPMETMFEDEIGSDVYFIVGQEPDVWRIPAQKKVLIDANPVFCAMFEGPLSTKESCITIHDVDSRAFNNLIRFLSKKDVVLKSVTTSLQTLFAAHKYLSSELVKLCVTYLDQNLTINNVLEVYAAILPFSAENYNRNMINNSIQPSAPREELQDINCTPGSQELDNAFNELSTNNNDLSVMCIYCDALRQNCLMMIDEHAEVILCEEDIENVDIDTLKSILSRNTLNIRSEVSVFAALMRWANSECKRRQLELNAVNRRTVIGDAKYEVRYLLMSSQDFFEPYASETLDTEESKFIWGFIYDKAPTVPVNLHKHVDKLSRERSFHCNTPIALSSRTYVNEPVINKSDDHVEKCEAKEKKKKSVKDKKNPKCLSRSGSQDSNSSEGKCSKFRDNVFAVLSCIFD